MIDTLSENEEGSSARLVGLFTYILRYDDLLAADATAIPPLGSQVVSFELRRSAGGSDPRVGSDSLWLPDPYLSTRHARIDRRGIVDVIQDLGSKHGTFVNGKPLVAGVDHHLQDGNLIEVGHSLLIYRLVDACLVESAEKVLLGPTRTLSLETMHLARDLARIAPTQRPVLLLGEPGTGKEIAARHIHEKSGRTGPLIAIDCGAIPEPLIESELFGHRRGAFTGAEERKGRIRSGDGGTVFLDEIGNLSETAQMRLLRAVQQREVVPVGFDKGQTVDVRWIAATNVDLFAEGARFRRDLRERLAGYIGKLPPLRERREDLGILSAHILKQAGIRKAVISKQAGRILFGGALPGNIRELENTLLRSFTLAEGRTVDVAHLKNPYLESASSSATAGEADTGAAHEVIRSDRSLPSSGRSRPNRQTILDALDKAAGVQGDAARLLGLHERQLARWMDALGIPRARSRQ